MRGSIGQAVGSARAARPARACRAGALLLFIAGCAAQPPPGPAPAETRAGPCPETVAPTEAAAEGVTVSTSCMYYDVRGDSAGELRRFMSQWGPTDETGTYDAYTRFDLRYRYHDADADGPCATGPVAVQLGLTHILPAWSPPPGAPGDLVARWRHYLGRLGVHEAGHADISIRAANELRGAFAELPAQPTCGALRVAAHDLFEGVVTRLRAQHRRYDRRTWHGKTQGSVFP